MSGKVQLWIVSDKLHTWELKKKKRIKLICQVTEEPISLGKTVLFGKIFHSMDSAVMSLKNIECSSRRCYAPLSCTVICFCFSLSRSLSHQWWHPCLCSPGRLFSQSCSSLWGCCGCRHRARWMNERGGSSRSHYSLCCTVCWPLSAWPWRCSTPAGYGERHQHSVRKSKLDALTRREMSNCFL